MSRDCNIVRVYPIRKTKKEWEIPIHCYHVCTQRCAQMYTRDPDESSPNTIRYILVDNPDYIDNKCPMHAQLEKTFVRLHLYDMDRPMGGTGPIYNPNMIVIPDNEFSVQINYPLSVAVDVNIFCSTSNGFTLAELIYSIKMLCHYIYQEDERTSTPRSYHLKKDCQQCIDKQIYDYVFEEKTIPESECSICYSKYTNKKTSARLGCNHVFHKECILRWLETGTTCPLCRNHVVQCDECNGTGSIFYDYNGTVIPVENRGHYLNRNTTDGIFEHDLEDLVIEYMHYNREYKLLTIYIGS